MNSPGATTPRPGLVRVSGALLVLAACGLTLLWAGTLAEMYGRHGFFSWIGVDYAVYRAQATVLREQGPGALYDRERLLAELSRVVLTHTHETDPTIGGEVTAYPPLFAGLFAPFAHPPVLAGFWLWTACNLLLAVHLAWRVSQLARSASPYRAMVVLLLSFPLLYTVIVGQAQLWLACSVAEACVALRAGRELRAGFFFSVLCFKPQYAALLVVVLIWKRRRLILLGLTGGMVVTAAGSALVAGFEATIAYLSALGVAASFHEHAPRHMVNWRSLVVLLAPAIGERAGWTLTAVLGALTALPVFAVWRGAWPDAEHGLPAKLALVFVATLLASPHSHAYGVVTAAAPLAWVAGGERRGRVLALLCVACALLPSLSFTLLAPYHVTAAAAAIKLTLLLAFVALLAQACAPAPARSASFPPDGPATLPR